MLIKHARGRILGVDCPPPDQDEKPVVPPTPDPKADPPKDKDAISR